jgi:hypothetical protein
LVYRWGSLHHITKQHAFALTHTTIHEWELTVRGQPEQHIRIDHTGDIIDDIVGPMINRPVIVDVLGSAAGRYRFQDIQAEE